MLRALKPWPYPSVVAAGFLCFGVAVAIPITLSEPQPTEFVKTFMVLCAAGVVVRALASAVARERGDSYRIYQGVLLASPLIPLATFYGARSLLPGWQPSHFELYTPLSLSSRALVGGAVFVCCGAVGLVIHAALRRSRRAPAKSYAVSDEATSGR